MDDVRSAQWETDHSELIVTMDDQFKYGDGFSSDYRIRLVDDPYMPSEGVFISSCVVDFDLVPEPSVLQWGFSPSEFWNAMETQNVRANLLWEHLSKELTDEF